MTSTYNTVAVRVAARFQADLSPPLGKPGGPCQVMQRIEEHVHSPELKHHLLDEVSHGEPLSNAEASKAYSIDHEGGGGLIKQLAITSHGQYRMDLRGVTVEDVRKALSAHGKMLNDFKAQHHPGFERMFREIQAGKVEFLDPKTGLFVAFDIRGSQAVLITTYWKGQTDPRAVTPSTCRAPL